MLYKEKSKNALKKRKNENFEKQKNVFFLLMSQGSLNPKIGFLGQKVCSVARLHTDTQTHRHTHTKVTTVGTLSGFKEFFLQPIIKDRPNIEFFHHAILATDPSHIFREIMKAFFSYDSQQKYDKYLQLHLFPCLHSSLGEAKYHIQINIQVSNKMTIMSITLYCHGNVAIVTDV